ncbi:MAG TPA: ABC transporter substrate-binding protein [bacterium]|nr:ABC transporter substrate-binding protein [bacterium]
MTAGISRTGYGWALAALLALPIACAPGNPKAPASGPVTITYWEKWNGFEGDAIQAVVDSFNTKQDRIHVDLMTVSEIEKKLLIAAAGGDPPDISGLYSRNVQVYAEKGALEPLDGDMAGHGIRLSDFIPIYLKECRLRDRTYALPIAGMTLALHYNKDLFKAAGLDPDRPPRTIREFEEYAQKLTLPDGKGGYQQMGFLPTEPGWWNWSWPYYTGGSLYDYKTHSVTADTPENRRALQWFADYSRKYGVAKTSAFRGGFGNFASPQNAFMAGKLAMILQGVWMPTFIRHFNPKLNYGVAPFPAYSEQVHDRTLIEGDVVVIPAGSPHPKEAMEFLAYLVSPEGQEKLSLLQGKFPMLKKVSKDFWRKNQNPWLHVFRDLADSPGAFTAPRMGIFAEYFDEGNAAFDQVWLLQKTPEEVLGGLQKRIGKLWARELRRMDRLGLKPSD